MKHIICEQACGCIEVNQEQLLTKDWCSLGARVPYWSGSPWRALGMVFRQGPTA